MYADEESRSAIARRLSVLPATIGMIGVALVIIGGSATGLVAQDRGWTWVLIAGTLVAATVVTGSASGLYIAMAVLSVAALGSGEPLTLVEISVLGLTLLVTHETVRFSLDARRPSRFGPGFVTGYITRTVGIAVLGLLAMAAAWPFATQDPPSTVWIPVGIAAASLPLFAPYFAGVLDRFTPFSGLRIRAGVAALCSLSVVVLVVLGAQARTSIESGEVGSSSSTAVVTPPTTLPPVIVDTDPVSIQRFIVFAAFLAIVLVIGVLYLALRRPEAAFELDDLDPGIDDMSFGFAAPGTVDPEEEEIIEVDDQDFAQLLREIQLDIETERDPGRAIRFGYATIERNLVDLRLTKDDSETEREFLTRVLPELGEAGDAMAVLTGLFEQARFGHEAVDEAMRQQALGAIDDLLGLLGHLQSEPDDQPEPAGGAV